MAVGVAAVAPAAARAPPVIAANRAIAQV